MVRVGLMGLSKVGDVEVEIAGCFCWWESWVSLTLALSEFLSLLRSWHNNFFRFPTSLFINKLVDTTANSKFALKITMSYDYHFIRGITSSGVSLHHGVSPSSHSILQLPSTWTAGEHRRIAFTKYLLWLSFIPIYKTVSCDRYVGGSYCSQTERRQTNSASDMKPKCSFRAITSSGSVIHPGYSCR